MSSDFDVALVGQVLILAAKGRSRIDPPGAAAIEIKDASEERGRVEARQAEPVERSATTDQGGGVEGCRSRVPQLADRLGADRDRVSLSGSGTGEWPSVGSVKPAGA